MRKIVQVLLDADNDLTALCDDGTLWVKNGDEWLRWDIKFPSEIQPINFATRTTAPCPPLPRTASDSTDVPVGDGEL